MRVLTLVEASADGTGSCPPDEKHFGVCSAYSASRCRIAELRILLYAVILPRKGGFL